MNFFQRAIQFFKEAYYELTKVSWLGRKEAVGTTIVVVIFMLIMAVFVSIVDFIVGGVIRSIL